MTRAAGWTGSSRQTARAAQEAGAVLIDTRSGDERRRDGVMPGALHVPRTVLEWRVDPETEPAYRNPHAPSLDQHVVVVCAHGYSSSLAAATLQELGFSRATDLVGGFEAWKADGLPVSVAPEGECDRPPGDGPTGLMSVELTGTDLTLDQVVAVARRNAQVEIADAALDEMRARRAIVERASADGVPVYGVTTGVGMRRDAAVDATGARAFNRSAILGHLVGLGPDASREVTRASLLRLANGIVAGYQGARPEVAHALVDALNADEPVRVSSLGTVGQADLAQHGDLAHGALAGLELEAGEALALLAGNAFSTGQAALAVADARALVLWLDAAAALDFEAFRGNVGALHPEIAVARPYPGIGETLARMRELLAGSALWETGEARFLQDPLTFRCVPQLHGATRDALRFVEQQLAIELNAHQGNPLVVVARGAPRLRRELRLAAARDRARPPPDRARARADGRGRAHVEAPEPAVQRARRGARSRRAVVAGRALRAGRRRTGGRRGGAACWRSPSRTSSCPPCRSRASRIERR